MTSIVLFDGVCNLCNGSVQFILKNDPSGHFRFASLQSEIGYKLLKQYRINKDINSIVLIENDKYYVQSSAVLRICRNLKRPWNFLSVFRFIPPPIRNYIYNLIARNRYKWFGRTDSCIIPTKDVKNRFLD